MATFSETPHLKCLFYLTSLKRILRNDTCLCDSRELCSQSEMLSVNHLADMENGGLGESQRFLHDHYCWIYATAAEIYSTITIFLIKLVFNRVVIMFAQQSSTIQHMSHFFQ